MNIPCRKPTKKIRSCRRFSYTSCSQAGFTLIEIMIVVLIIGILLSIAVPEFIRARETTRTKACVSNLRKIEWAKDQWAIENKKGLADTPVTADLAGSFKYLTDLPDCPSDGTYSLNSMSTPPTCSLSAQAAPFQHKIP